MRGRLKGREEPPAGIGVRNHAYQLPLSDPTILHFDEVDDQVAIGKVLVDGPCLRRSLGSDPRPSLAIRPTLIAYFTMLKAEDQRKAMHIGR
jgi:hypothetical protein